MRGVIVSGQLYGANSNSQDADELIVFCELEEGTLHLRRAFGQRASVASFDLDEVQAAIEALITEDIRRKIHTPSEGPTEFDPAEE